MSKRTKGLYLMAFMDADGRLRAIIEHDPDATSDHKDAHGRPLTLIAAVPVQQAIAAPDLLAALEGLIALHADDGTRSDVPEWNRARAAIAKAEGRLDPIIGDAQFAA